MSSMRTKGKSTIVWLLMGVLLLGLGGFGVTNFSGGVGGDDLGEVGSTPVSSADYLRVINQEMQSFSAQTGQKITPDQARQIGLPQVVQARLFAAAALEDEANRLGLSVGDEAVADQLRSAQAFKGLDGRFDPARYNELLRAQGLTVADFEHDVRMDQARMILQNAITGGVKAPEDMARRTAGWLLETRDIHWQELTDADLPQPIAAPDDATLRAWHEANAQRFTAPEKRQLTYVWLTPEMLIDSVELNEQALRDLYQQHIDQYQQPERRMVERLTYPSDAEAQAAKARLDAGQATFEQLANERGQSLAEIDLGEVAEGDLGAAGQPVFALAQPGVVGPIATDQGPALFSMNAILDPLKIPFEEAVVDLRAEAAADAARRQIDEKTGEYEDLLAGGAELEDMPKETPLQVGKIDWYQGIEQAHGSITAYPEFRERAPTVTKEDFPELLPLGDGGLFAVRLDNVIPPAPIPFDEARDQVLADWTAAERVRRLTAVAEEREVAAMAPGAATPATTPASTPQPAPADPAAQPGTPAPSTPAPATSAPAANTPQPMKPATGITRDMVIDGAVPDLARAAFDLADPGDTDTVVAGNRLFLVRLDAVKPADLDSTDARTAVDGVARAFSDGLQSDMFEYYVRAIQQDRGATVNTAAIAAADARIQ